ncbi:hypothetical protein Tco_0702003 [Tanacetum coccineum]|uniref:Uncharacterized protein n=1 Tax=Tanacetum coccineum TaxID=301880 RepID=A0ABQ4XWI5_9ASTR
MVWEKFQKATRDNSNILHGGEGIKAKKLPIRGGTRWIRILHSEEWNRNMKQENISENMTISKHRVEARKKKQYVHLNKQEVRCDFQLSIVRVWLRSICNTLTAKIDLYYELPLLLPYFQPIQPRAKSGYESPYVDIVRDTDSIAEYESKEGEREPNKHTEKPSMNGSKHK